jgi:hypothetical protein
MRRRLEGACRAASAIRRDCGWFCSTMQRHHGDDLVLARLDQVGERKHAGENDGAAGGQEYYESSEAWHGIRLTNALKRMSGTGREVHVVQGAGADNALDRNEL